MKGGLCVVAELLRVDRGFDIVDSVRNRYAERFVQASQVEEVFCYGPTEFAQEVRQWGAELWEPLFCAAHMPAAVALAGGNPGAQWSPSTGGIVTVVKMANQKWFIVHPYDYDKLFDRPHGFCTPGAGSSNESSVPSKFKKQKTVPKLN